MIDRGAIVPVPIPAPGGLAEVLRRGDDLGKSPDIRPTHTFFERCMGRGTRETFFGSIAIPFPEALRRADEATGTALDRQLASRDQICNAIPWPRGYRTDGDWASD